jgi:carbon monoxide dehydrogenase subunit G
MGRLVVNYKVQIEAEPTAVYDYLADFTRHGEWSDGLSIDALGDGPTEVGSEFRSVGRQLGKDVINDIKIVEAQRPSRLAFTASDGRAEFLQDINLSENAGGTLLRRTLSIDMNPIMVFMFKALIGPMVANPAMNKSLKNLKAKLEES